MTFINHTKNGKVIIQPLALTLSKLDKEQVLEMHTLDNAVILLKQDMSAVEYAETMVSLLQLLHHLLEKCGEPAEDEQLCADAIPIPTEAFMEAGLFGKDLRIQTIDGAVIITEDVDDD